MIPTAAQAKVLWDVYSLPEAKRNHCMLVARVAVWFARSLSAKLSPLEINTGLLEAAALLHDIDKNIPRLPGEHHPDTAVRVLYQQGFGEVADLVRTHPIHAILDLNISPKTWEEKILYLSDKMVKHSIITVDERFALWRAENLPPDAVAELDVAYKAVKALENELCSFVGVSPSDVAKLATRDETSTMKSHPIRRNL